MVYIVFLLFIFHYSTYMDVGSAAIAGANSSALFIVVLISLRQLIVRHMINRIFQYIHFN